MRPHQQERSSFFSLAQSQRQNHMQETDTQYPLQRTPQFSTHVLRDQQVQQKQSPITCWKWASSSLLLSIIMGLCSCTGEDPIVRGTVTLRQLIAVTLDAPEARPGQNVTIQGLVVDPNIPTLPLEIAIISCTTFTGVVGCMEEVEVLEEDDINLDTGEVSLDPEDYAELMQNIVHRQTLESSTLATSFSTAYTIPVAFTTFLTELEYSQVDASLFVLVCDQGKCPSIELMDAYLAGDVNAISHEEMLELVSDPELLLSGASIEGVALGRKNYKISQRNERSRNHNPSLIRLDTSACVPLLTSYSPGTCTISGELSSDSLEIYNLSDDSTTQTQEAVVMRFYTTLGSVSPFAVQIYPSSYPMQSTTITLEYTDLLPAQMGLFAVAVDSRGGMDALGQVLDITAPSTGAATSTSLSSNTSGRAF